ncbi:YbhB/YbcL family Raf kinase inhibitor-like protein [Streptomyces sp. NK08204]|uniref:YbhB/YbcL family Raf kinase inhibitor-like protein n=1 Tax=Streptomyces sp. NK08204 TaxID=2873260 RepID=UPI001CED7C0C|nr:YbhB/YbcL family Raf kinase inhibitor-like protein [Streptomyces sp. NK08204]
MSGSRGRADGRPPRSGTAAVLAVALAAVCGCGTGGDGGSASAPARSATQRITVTSPAYADGGAIPGRYTCDGADVSPPLDLSGVPTGTASLALLLQDPDAPHGTFTHWLAWDIGPHTTHLAAAEHPEGAVDGRNDFGRTGYGGPCPPRGDHPHRYVLTVYATDRRPSLPPDTTATGLLRSLTGHTLATGALTGRYERQSGSGGKGHP